MIVNTMAFLVLVVGEFAEFGMCVGRNIIALSRSPGKSWLIRNIDKGNNVIISSGHD